MHPTPIDERVKWLYDTSEWLSTLEPFQGHPDTLGLLPRPPDPRDFNLAEAPGVAEALAVGFPDSGDLTQHVKGVYDQGSVPSCVSHTAAAGQSIFQQQEEGVWRVFDAPRVHADTGSISQGRWPTDILKYAQTNGLPLVNSNIRYKIASYAFAQAGGGWADTIKAALSTGRPVWICMLIPSSFGWESGGNLTQGYHEVLIVGWRPDAFLILNSWGSRWGRNGLGWVPISYLQQENYHRGMVLAHTVVDERIGPPPPPPPPPPLPPTPPVDEIKVKNLLDDRGQPVRGMDVGKTVRVVGTGFDRVPGPVLVKLGGTPTNVLRLLPTEIEAMVVAPVGVAGTVAILGGPSQTVAARSEFAVVVHGPEPLPPPVKPTIITAEVATGDAKTVTVGQTLTIGNAPITLRVTKIERGSDGEPSPPPPPDGELELDVVRTRGGLLVRVKDTSGRYVAATVAAQLGSQPLQAFRNRTAPSPDGGSSVPATFTLSVISTGTVTVTARDDAGRGGTTTLVV